MNLGFGRVLVNVGEYLVDDVGILETRDDPHPPAGG